MKAPFLKTYKEKVLFLGCGPALHDVETTRRCIVASLRPEMSEAAALTSRCALKCLTQRAVRRVSGWHLWRVGLALVTCWVGTCGGPCGVSGLSVWLVAGRAACRGFLCGLWRAVRRVEFCRKLDFFKHLRKKANKRTDSGREICRILSKSVESWIFQRMS